jgi:hypothetical protein
MKNSVQGKSAKAGRGAEAGGGEEEEGAGEVALLQLRLLILQPVQAPVIQSEGRPRILKKLFLQLDPFREICEQCPGTRISMRR